MKDPAFLFYSSDFLTGVADLTFEERGQFITLLCLQHQKGRLTKKMIDLAAPSVSNDVLLRFKVDQDGNFYNSRLEREIEKRAVYSEKQRAKANARWSKKEENQDATVSAAALPQDIQQHMPRHMPFLENENEIEIDNKNEKGKGGTGEKPKRTIFVPPTVSEIANYCHERQNKINAQAFFDFYASKGWMIGSNKMKDWQAAVRTWEAKNRLTSEQEQKPKFSKNRPTQ